MGVEPSGPLIETRLRLVTWNVWSRSGPWERRQEAILGTLEALDADVIVLQEAWREPEVSSQATSLGTGLGMHHVYSPSWVDEGLEVGNAVLSRWNIRNTATRALPVDGLDRRRTVLMAEVLGPRGPFTVFTTHLTYGFDESALRQQQVAAISQFVAETRLGGFPAILAGDFNAVPDSDEIRMLTGRAAAPVRGLTFYDAWDFVGNDTPGYSWSNENPYIRPLLQRDRRIDYVLVGQPTSGGAGHIVSAALAGTDPVGTVVPSDHYALIVELRY